MGSLIGMVMLASLAADTPALPRPFRLDCTGTSASRGYPDGARDTGETHYRVESRDGRIRVLRRGRQDDDICPTGATCAVSITDTVVDVRVGQVPDADPLYSTRFRLDRKRLTFDAGGGGLDGGWSVTGTCVRR